MNQMNATIGRWQGAGLMATTLLGTGVFILPQMTIEVAGSASLLAWLLLTVAIIPVALVFGLLASRFPHASGPAYFIEKAFGATAGRTIGLIFLLVIPIGAPAAILMTFQFLEALISISGLGQLVAELLIVAVLLLLNIKGIQVSAKLQFMLTLLIVAVVAILFGASGLNVGQLENFAHSSHPQFSGVMLAMGIGFWSFLGIEAMTHLASDFRQPDKDLLPAMMMGTVLVGVIYLACTFLLLMVPTEGAGLAMISAFDYLLSNTFLSGYGAYIIGILGIASGLATVNVYAASAARLLWSFSKEGILPRYFDKLNPHGVPFRALFAILGSMAVVIVVTYFSSQELEDLIAWSNGVFVIIYLLAMLSAAKLLSKRYLPLVIAGCVFCIGLGIALGSNMIYATVLVLVIAPFMFWQKAHLTRKYLMSNTQG
ncbi:L-methionine/branched-chain amino acid transporter [Shewanella sp. SR43-4]|jgi:amino acid efflux transporter|uniref:L-methionine/branched-chain amino acid transporter n=1 Tax=Shewanella vesiculosa TaxID=518738 RepID=A0ABV0FRW0_9GAMM|nr:MULTISPECIES: L-methionine/branched-chain amino acid transporter [Shewanella]NCQ44868.1 L-methionine/branched-chain amino acid transporter [Shewanella frigidimarina]MBB1317708.1 L-methionine/branched-chain amino acid transporter [Shewanella sp. SR43-4]MBB1322292.1 L-methionine/branched-chain amino acid transporter [Shewanella sp. SR43-8]NCO71997.1 L-methionine/branched-chain amino acid transporter [Shewanella vesiculosa]NCP37281.1 L-methionine/branched-chain amino acid transporter [Shewanel|tara:strand:- start:1479 stop:2762 length:1284 start_codon:yes stop_codon:yes gene_type:complete